MCRGCPPIILGGFTLSYPRNVRGLPPRLQSPGCVGVVPLSFLAVLSYPRNVRGLPPRGLPPRLQSPGCVGVVPLSFLAVLPYIPYPSHPV
ncbi:unnamed protein product [Nezara viridula]|uniref:Uncharacterized protein n=1 Tax=Nezara viridula TaxID=85310 RepID=A0A9P0E284_NEZVI|nr:unnamed protein product [Nezara viridula]